jgi:transposase
MKERKSYTKEFKQGAVRLVTEQSRSLADVSKSLGVPSWSLSRWVRAAQSDGQDAFCGNGHRPALEQETFELRQKVNQLEEEKQILQKAAAYFAVHLR